MIDQIILFQSFNQWFCIKFKKNICVFSTETNWILFVFESFF